MALSKFHTLNPRKIEHKVKTIIDGVKPLVITWDTKNSPASIEFSDGRISFGSCVRCTNPPCMFYAPNELKLPIFDDFPSDQNNLVCPTSSISWTPEMESPEIDEENCILCGICVSRCPVKAIYFHGDTPKINDVPNEHFVKSDLLSNSEITLRTWTKFTKVSEIGSYQLESDLLLKIFRDKFQNVAKEQTAQFPNHLARNLLIALGVGSAMRRRGDTSIRMDLILGAPGVNFGTGEVEFGSGILDAPRDILDDIAVLVSRYEISKDEIVPLIVCLDFPNLRSEYWQFIKDVKNVLNLKINSVTIGALVIMLWNRVNLLIENGDELYLDIDSPTLKPKLEKILGRQLKIKGDGYAGLLVSAK